MWLWPGEVMDEESACAFFGTLQNVSDDVMGVALPIRLGPHDEFALGIEVRAFRNRNAIVFEGHAPDDVAPSISRIGGQVIEMNAEVGVTRQSESYDERLDGRLNHHARLHQDLIERGDDPLTRLRLAKSHYSQGNYFHAECYAHNALEHFPPGGRYWRQAAYVKVASYLNADHFCGPSKPPKRRLRKARKM